MQQQAIGVDIGGTKMLAAIVEWDIDASGAMERPSGTELPVVLRHETRVATPTDTAGFAATLNGLISTLQSKASHSLPVGISSAGMIQPSTTAILGSTGNMPALQGVPSFADLLPETAHLTALNDANAAAYGEYALLTPEEKAQYSHVLMITLGTGIGGGLVVKGQIYDGEQGGAMEVGHICLDPRSQRQCTCGKIGCWEAYASGTGLHSTLMKALADAAHQRAEAGSLLEKSQSGQAVTTYDLMAAVDKADPLALQIMDTWHGHLAQGLAAVISVLNPGLLILGGGLGNAVDVPKLKALLKPRILQPLPDMRTAQMENAAGLVGAALLSALPVGAAGKTHLAAAC